MTEAARFLDVFKPDGTWIERPDLFLYARMALPNSDDDGVVQQVYETMLRADNSKPVLNLFEADIADRMVARKATERIYSGQVILELCRIAAATKKPPGFRQAVRLVAYNHIRLKRTPSSVASIERSVRSSFQLYRSTAHLQAAMLYLGAAFIEDDLEAVGRFLSIARGLEGFIDLNVVHQSFQWQPIRVPISIPPASNIYFKSLRDDELSLLNAT